MSDSRAQITFAMPVSPEGERRLAYCRRAARLGGRLAVLVGVTVLLGGWAAGIETLKTVFPGYAPMAPNTALGIVLLGTAIWLDPGVREQRMPGDARRVFLIRMVAVMAALIGVLTLIEYFFGKNLALDELLFRNPPTFLSPPTRMAAVTAMVLVLLAGAVLLSRHPRAFAAGQHLAVVAGVLCLFNSTGVLYGIQSFYQPGFKTGGTTMAIHTSLMLGLLCCALLFSRPDWGFMRTITSQGPGGMLSRRLLPGAIFIPYVYGWVRWQGQRHGIFDAPFGLTLLTSFNVVTFSVLVWRCGKTLFVMDTVRARAQSTALQTQQALVNSEASFEQLANSMPQMVWTADSNGNFEYYNLRWYDYTGMDLEQSRAKGWTLLHPEDLRKTKECWEQSLTTGEPYHAEHRLKRASDGVYRWHLAQGRPIRNGQGEVVRWFLTCTDIEDYKQAERKIGILNEGLEQRVHERTSELDGANRQLAAANDELKNSAARLERTNRELQDFAAVASHDLQEPLRKVQAFGDRLQTSYREALDDRGRDYLDRMLNAAKRMQGLIQDLLQFARVTSQARPFSPVDLSRVAKEVLSDLEVRIGETNALVEVGDLPVIDADPMQIRQLLQNLIGNALKFHQAGKPPAVRVYAENRKGRDQADGMFRLVVKDEGIGFDEKYLDRIFTVFQRLHGRAEYEGTGVGLAICRKIAQRHGGDITARSAPGHGASFLVALPLHHAATREKL